MPLRSAGGPEHVDDLVEKLRQVRRKRLQPEAPGFDARNVENFVDERQQVLAALSNRLDGIPPMRGHLRVTLQNLRVADDAVEWRAQLVAHIGEEASLGLIGVLGGFLRLLQLRVGTPVFLDFLLKQQRLTRRLLFGHASALARQHQPPRRHTSDDE